MGGRRYDDAVREARADLGTREARRVDWASMDEALFARIDGERRAAAAREVERDRSGRSRAWLPVAVGLAAAAALAMVVGRTQGPRPIDAAQGPAVAGAGSVTAVDAAGQLAVDGKPADLGTELRLGDVLETHGAQVTVERPGKLTMVLERGTRARVT